MLFPYGFAVCVAVELDLASLPLFTGICKEYRTLLYSPVVWKRRCENKRIRFTTFTFLGTKKATTEMCALSIFPDCRNVSTFASNQHRDFAPKVTSLDISGGPTLNVVGYLLNAICPIASLTHLSLDLSQSGGRFDVFLRDRFAVDSFAGLKSLKLCVRSFASCASVVASRCPHLTFLDVCDGLSEPTDAPVLSFRTLEDLTYAGSGEDVAKYFRTCTRLLSLNLQECLPHDMRDWTVTLGPECRSLEVLRVPFDAPDDEIVRMLTEWHRSLKTVYLPSGFVRESGGLVDFFNRFRGRLRLENVYYYRYVSFNRFRTVGVVTEELRNQLMESCLSLKKIEGCSR